MRNFKTNQRYGGGFQLAPRGVKRQPDVFELMEVPTGIKLPPDHNVHILGFSSIVGTERRAVTYDESSISERSWHELPYGGGGLLIVTTADDFMHVFEVKEDRLHIPENASDVKFVPVRRTNVVIERYRYKLLDVMASWMPMRATKGALSCTRICEQYHRPTDQPHVVEIVTRPQDGRVPDDYVIFVVDMNKGTIVAVNHEGIPLVMPMDEMHVAISVTRVNGGVRLKK